MPSNRKELRKQRRGRGGLLASFLCGLGFPRGLTCRLSPVSIYVQSAASPPAWSLLACSRALRLAGRARASPSCTSGLGRRRGPRRQEASTSTDLSTPPASHFPLVQRDDGLKSALKRVKCRTNARNYY